jgi:hypothetical protein
MTQKNSIANLGRISIFGLLAPGGAHAGESIS